METEGLKPICHKEESMGNEIIVLMNKVVMNGVPCWPAKSFHIDIVLSATVEEFIGYAKSKNANIFIAEDGIYIKLAFILNGKLIGIVKPSKTAPNGVVEL